MEASNLQIRNMYLTAFIKKIFWGHFENYSGAFKKRWKYFVWFLNSSTEAVSSIRAACQNDIDDG